MIDDRRSVINITRLLLFTLTALAVPLQASTAKKENFFVINFPNLQSIAAAWEADDRKQLDIFTKNHAFIIGKIRYLVIPSEYLDRSLPPPASPQFQAIVEVSLPTGAQYLRGVDIHPELLSLIIRTVDDQTIGGSLTGDVAILNHEDILQLARLVWFNRANSLTSDEGEEIKNFDRNFLDSLSRRWFLNPRNSQAQNRLFITGLRSGLQKNASALLYIPDHNGPAPLFYMFSGERRLFDNMIRLLRSETVRICLSFNFADRHFPSQPGDFQELLRDLEVRIPLSKTESESEYLQYFPGQKLGPWTLSLDGYFSRRVLTAEGVDLLLTGSKFRFIQDGQITDSLHLPFPTPEDILDEDVAHEFRITITNPKTVPRLRILGPQRYLVTLSRPELAARAVEIRNRYRRLAKRGTSSDLDLFESPESVLTQVLADRRRPRLELTDTERRFFSNGILEVRNELEALWDHLSVEASLSAQRTRILIVRPSSDATLPSYHRGQMERQYDLVTLYLRSKIDATGSRFKILESGPADPGASRSDGVEIQLLAEDVPGDEPSR